MDKEELNNYKRRHNALLLEGQQLYKEVMERHAVLMMLRELIKKEEGEDKKK